MDGLSEIYLDINLLKGYIRRAVDSYLPKDAVDGKKVLLKPNWVKQPVNSNDVNCLCTHPNFIIAFVEVLIEWNPQSVLIADAPIQGCDWNELLPQSFIDAICQLSLKTGISITVRDFRRAAYSQVSHKIEYNIRPMDDYIVFDTAKRSYLEEITGDNNLFRVTSYDPDRMAEAHKKGTHRYCIAKEVFECDTIITIPKIKTHQKSGITNSLKILVGLNGDKDFLPHHRLGPVENGGDCYKGRHPFRSMSERVLDEANRHIGGWLYRPLSLLSAALWRLSKPTREQNLSAGWYGNDTVWRMVMDINMIAQYGKADGTLASEPQRTIYTLCDGIIGGQGNGPLSPDPLALGVIAFSNDAFAMDEVAGRLFKLNLDRVPLLREAKNMNKNKKISYFIDGKMADLTDVDPLAVDVVMPPGWVNYDRL